MDWKLCAPRQAHGPVGVTVRWLGKGWPCCWRRLCRFGQGRPCVAGSWPSASVFWPQVRGGNQSGTFVTVGEPALTHPRQLQSVVYLRVHLRAAHSVVWADVVYAVFPSLCYDTDQSHCPKTLCALPVPPSLSPPAGNRRSVYRLHNFTFSRMSYSWNYTLCSLFSLASFT